MVDSVGNNKEAKNMTEALDSASELGFTVEKLTPRSSGDIVWDQVNNKFALLDKDGKFVFADEKTKSVEKHQLWVIVENDSQLKDEYSNYIKGSVELKDLTVKTGLDVGKNYAQKITYTGDKNVIIRTNGDASKLIVNHENATVHHYGFAKEVNVINCDANCYYLYGSVTTLKLGEGARKVVIEKSAVVFGLSLSEGVTFNSNNMKIENSGVILQADNSLKKGANISSSSDYEIDSAEKLGFFRDAVNSGADFKDVKVVLTKDITLEGAWTPIGVGSRKPADSNESYSGNAFKGTFDGKSHTISGLTNTGYISTATYYATKHKVDTFAYGLFGLVDNATIQNLKLSNVNIDAISHKYFKENKEVEVKGDSIGAIVGFCGGGLTMKNCEVVSGTVNGFDAVGGLVGRIYDQNNNDKVDEIIIENCVNRASVSGDIKVAGILGYTGPKANGHTLKVTECKNYGKISAKDSNYSYINGILGFGGGNDPKNQNNGYTTNYTITHNENYGDIVAENVGNICASTIAGNCSNSIKEGSETNISDNKNNKLVTIGSINIVMISIEQHSIEDENYKEYQTN